MGPRLPTAPIINPSRLLFCETEAAFLTRSWQPCQQRPRTCPLPFFIELRPKSCEPPLKKMATLRILRLTCILLALGSQVRGQLVPTPSWLKVTCSIGLFRPALTSTLALAGGWPSTAPKLFSTPAWRWPAACCHQRLRGQLVWRSAVQGKLRPPLPVYSYSVPPLDIGCRESPLRGQNAWYSSPKALLLSTRACTVRLVQSTCRFQDTHMSTCMPLFACL
jgi:hypothetical protein